MKMDFVCSTFAAAFLFATITVYADSAATSSTTPLYIGIFGGGGALMDDHITQEGTAFFTEAEGGPLAVNAKGNASGNSVWLAGGHVGYAGNNFILTKTPSAWNMTPAIEMEAYYIGNSELKANLTNNTDRLAAHEFSVSYPMDIGVFLANAIFTFNDAEGSKVHPYLGLGIGAGVVSIDGAKSIQTEPSEPGVNHYNSDNNDTSSTFAFQPKAGIRFDLNSHVSLFAEYRFLYLASNTYTFGSTVYSDHVATSDWTVKMDAMTYNFGLAGIRYSF